MKRQQLPYLNDWKLIALTIAINVACAFVFWHEGYGSVDFLIDTVICVWITAFIDVFAVAYFIRKHRLGAQYLYNPPSSWLIKVLPANRLWLSVILAIAFTVIMSIINEALFYFYEFKQLTHLQFIVWKGVYSFVLSSWIVTVAIFRILKAEADKCGEVMQSENVTSDNSDIVKNPTPRISWLTSFLNGMFFDFGLNLVIGYPLGGVIVKDHIVSIMPTPCTGIGMVISTVLTGAIITFFVVPQVITSVYQSIGLGKPRKLFWKTLAFVPLFCVLVTLACWGIFSLFNFEILSFFQFYLIRILLISILCKMLVPLLVWIKKRNLN